MTSDDRPANRPGRKPTWVIDKERARRAAANETLWLFGLHAVRDALANPARHIEALVLTRNAADRIGALPESAPEPEIVEPRSFLKHAPLAPESVHQGAAIRVRPLDWGNITQLLDPGPNDLALALDRVSDPHNVGALLRSAEVFGARAVIGTLRNAAPESGALAKTASGALERQPYLRVTNLSNNLEQLKAAGWLTIGLAGEAEHVLPDLLDTIPAGPVCLVLGAEGPGLRERTRATCDLLARIPFAGSFGSLNVSNAGAVALYAANRAANRHNLANSVS